MSIVDVGTVECDDRLHLFEDDVRGRLDPEGVVHLPHVIGRTSLPIDRFGGGCIKKYVAVCVHNMTPLRVGVFGRIGTGNLWMTADDHRVQKHVECTVAQDRFLLTPEVSVRDHILEMVEPNANDPIQRVCLAARHERPSHQPFGENASHDGGSEVS